jgi:hypothetical protein
VRLVSIDEVVDKTCHRLGSFRVGVVSDTGKDVQAAVRHRLMRCVCVGNGDNWILVTADDHHWLRGIEMQAIQCAYRLAAAVDDPTQRL